MEQEEFIEIYNRGPEETYKFFLKLYVKIEELSQVVEAQNKRIQELEKKSSKDSNNSSKPPSTDGFKKKRKDKRGKSKRRQGGQKKHKGSTLRMVGNPDRIIKIEIETCKNCQYEFTDSEKGVEKRQEVDIRPIRMEIAEYQVEQGKCPCCGVRTGGEFPAHIKKAIQYGKRFRSLLVYLNQYQLVPYQRTVEIIEDLFSYSFSKGTLFNAINECYNKLDNPEKKIKQMLTDSQVVHFDESGGYCCGKRGWFHVACNATLTFFGFHEKRGKEAINDLGILPKFHGHAVHDFYPSYLKYLCNHILCSAHLLRELKFQHEEVKQRWAFKLKDLILDTKKLVDWYKTNRKRRSLPTFKIAEVNSEYDKIVKSGLGRNPRNKGTPGKRGRVAQTDTRNLLQRLRDWKKSYLAFMYDFNLPFDNNQAERDIRMLKVQQKISGCFRSEVGAKYFCRIRGYISTVRKNGQNVLDALTDAFDGHPFIPDFAE